MTGPAITKDEIFILDVGDVELDLHGRVTVTSRPWNSDSWVVNPR